MGFRVANQLRSLGGHPTELYLRAAPDQVTAVNQVLPFTANPAQPEAVQVSRPSDVLAARAAAKNAITGLFLGLGAVVVLGGPAGVGLGALATAVYAIAATQTPVVPLSAVAAGLAVALSVGLLAGAYPASQAARLAPAGALRAS